MAPGNKEVFPFKPSRSLRTHGSHKDTQTFAACISSCAVEQDGDVVLTVM